MKRFKKIICLSAVLLILIGNTISVFASEQLIKNSGFELNSGKTPFLWNFSSYNNLGKATSDSTVKHDGKFSVQIYNAQNDHSRITQKITVEPNSIYHFSCWIKTENAAPVSKDGKPDTTDNKGANIAIDGSNDAYSELVINTTDWKKIEMYRKIDADTTELAVQLALGGYGSTISGKAWFDDFTVEKVDTVPVGFNATQITFFNKPSKAASNNDLITVLSVIGVGILFVGGIAGYMIFVARKKSGSSKKGASSIKSDVSPNNVKQKSNTLQANESAPVAVEKVKIQLKDILIMGVCTVIYAVFAFTNLGSLNVPETNWTSQTSGDSFVVELPKQITTSRIGLYYGYGNAKFQVDYMTPEGKYAPFASFGKEEGNLFKWNFMESPVVPGSSTPGVTSNKFRISVDEVGGTYTDGFHNGALNEIAFYSVDPTTRLFKQIDITGAKITDIKLIDNSTPEKKNQNFAAMIDEQNKVDAYATFSNGFYFDEIYHARTAYENIHDLPVYETTHPPLGKLIISVGIRIFGMNPFGWRCMGTLFGVLMLPLMYLFALKLFKRRFLAFAAMLLMTVDFMHFSLSRIATIDIYGTFFVLLMYYFMYDYFVNKSINIGYKQSLRSLLLCGIAFGLGAASKWIGLYAAFGLALLFFLTKYQEYKQFSKITSKWKSSKTGWVKDFVPLYMTRTIVWCLLFFIVIPMIIYVGSYFPSYLNVPGSDLSVISSNQSSMLSYHSGLTATHPYSSQWNEWPLITRPLYVFGGMTVPEGPAYASKIFIMGNPAIFWVGLLAVPFAAYFAIKRRSRGMVVVIVAILFQYLPWIPVPRITFIYHIFSSVPFIIFSIIYCIDSLFEKNKKIGDIILIAYMVICTALFAMFYPILSGYTVPITYIETYLNWFKNSSLHNFFRWDF